MTVDAELNSELLDAIAAAYALVSAADSNMVENELERLRIWGESQGFERATINDLLDRCRGFAQGLLTHPESNRPVALDRVGAMEDTAQAATVLSAARVAVVADAQIDDREERALESVAEALGLDPKDA